MILISIILALTLERLGARSAHWQIDYYLQRYLNMGYGSKIIKKQLNNGVGFMCYLVLPVIAVAFIYQLSDFALWQFVLNILVLIVCFGCNEPRRKYKGYLNALTRGDDEAATLYALQMGQVRTEHEHGGEWFGQTLAWVNFRHYCAVMFWFVVLGVPGAVLYASIRTAFDLTVAQQKSAAHYQHQSRLDGLLFCLNWLPARLTSFGYLIIGNFSKGTHYWVKYALNFSITNRKLVTTTALAAEQIEQQYAGCTYEATCMMRLVKRNVLLFLALVAGLTLFGQLA
ncbi:regulatory signaling modulator protein AmpE [Pseudoalteromonas sp. MSK9-3]|uniref:beta-lactamase regulator AmpE n=1 Tax=Pseudoalteromonas sp. MSK9-3 TaxID=1897633 RepID=UPI000E6C0877|nr:beta-lactamase regulator AmpE [Pseudoalteromonas sp. MSK9-3]RJE76664.1 regulatory signaling modulator protein AmpE [Pseudoalteromonas sp. MSK9-3]